MIVRAHIGPHGKFYIISSGSVIGSALRNVRDEAVTRVYSVAGLIYQCSVYRFHVPLEPTGTCVDLPHIHLILTEGSDEYAMN